MHPGRACKLEQGFAFPSLAVTHPSPGMSCGGVCCLPSTSMTAPWERSPWSMSVPVHLVGAQWLLREQRSLLHPSLASGLHLWTSLQPDSTS